jgi:formate dehydrogenase major subunit
MARGVKDGDFVRVASRFGQIELRAKISERVNPGVVYTTFHHAKSKANAVTSDLSDWATNCPEYKVTAVDVVRTNGPAMDMARDAAKPRVEEMEPAE